MITFCYFQKRMTWILGLAHADPVFAVKQGPKRVLPTFFITTALYITNYRY